jgi:hypothetical protein
MARQASVYWTAQHERAVIEAAQVMKDAGIPCERDGKPNVSQVILYALEQLARQSKKR